MYMAFSQVFFFIVFARSFFMVFSHGLCCLFMAWSLATPIRQGRPFTVELDHEKRQCKKTTRKDHEKRP